MAPARPRTRRITRLPAPSENRIWNRLIVSARAQGAWPGSCPAAGDGRSPAPVRIFVVTGGSWNPDGRRAQAGGRMNRIRRRVSAAVNPVSTAVTRWWCHSALRHMLTGHGRRRGRAAFPRPAGTTQESRRPGCGRRSRRTLACRACTPATERKPPATKGNQQHDRSSGEDAHKQPSSPLGITLAARLAGLRANMPAGWKCSTASEDWRTESDPMS